MVVISIMGVTVRVVRLLRAVVIVAMATVVASSTSSSRGKVVQ